MFSTFAHAFPVDLSLIFSGFSLISASMLAHKLSQEHTCVNWLCSFACEVLGQTLVLNGLYLYQFKIWLKYTGRQHKIWRAVWKWVRRNVTVKQDISPCFSWLIVWSFLLSWIWDNIIFAMFHFGCILLLIHSRYLAHTRKVCTPLCIKACIWPRCVNFVISNWEYEWFHVPNAQMSISTKQDNAKSSWNQILKLTNTVVANFWTRHACTWFSTHPWSWKKV